MKSLDPASSNGRTVSVSDNPLISVVIPTYERGSYIKRQLAYWRDFPVQVLIIDGSPAPSISEQEAASYPNARYLYHPSWYGKQLELGCSEVKTRYAVILDDDEFILYTGLVEASAILEENPEVSAVLGATIGYSLFNGRMVAKPIYEPNLQLKISGPSPSARLDQRLSVHGSTTLYALARREVVQIAGKFIGERKYSCPYITEYQIESVWCAAGKVAIIPSLMSVRNRHNGPVLPPGLDRSLYLHEWCDKPENKVDRGHLIASADRYLSLFGNDRITGDEFLTKFGLRSELSLEQIRKEARSVAHRARKMLPEKLRPIMRMARDTVMRRPPGGFLSIEKLFRRLREQNIRFDEAELIKLRNAVESTEG